MELEGLETTPPFMMGGAVSSNRATEKYVRENGTPAEKAQLAKTQKTATLISGGIYLAPLGIAYIAEGGLAATYFSIMGTPVAAETANEVTAFAWGMVTDEEYPLPAVGDNITKTARKGVSEAVDNGADLFSAFKTKLPNVFKGIDKTHLDAAIGDMAGNPIVKYGKVWDHLDDITSHMRGLNGKIKELDGLISGNKLSGDVLEEATKLRSSLQKQYDSYYGALQRAANKYDGEINVKKKK